MAASSPQSTIIRQLIRLAVPIIGINVLNVMALAIDTAMLGHLDETGRLLTALGFATQLVFLLMVLMIGLSVGTTALVARAHGAREKERINHLLLQSTMLTALVGIAVAIVGNLLAPAILRLLGASEDTLQDALTYLRPLLTCTVFSFLTILYGAVMRGVGNTRLPFLVALVSTVVNVGLNYLLIYGKFGLPALGILGASLGTATSQIVSTVLLAWILRRGQLESLYLPLRPRPIDRALVRELLRIGSPASMDILLLNAGFLSIVGMLGYLDELAVAAHSIGMRIQSLAFVPGLGVAQATGAMVGHALGAGNVTQARQVTRAALLICTGIMTSLALLIMFAVYPIVALFDVAPGSPIEAYSVEWIRLLGMCMLPVGWHIALAGALQGAGATRVNLRINLATTVLFQIPASAILGFGFDLGTFGIWVAFPLSFVLKAILTHRAYRGDSWAKAGVHV